MPQVRLKSGALISVFIAALYAASTFMIGDNITFTNFSTGKHLSETRSIIANHTRIGALFQKYQLSKCIFVRSMLNKPFQKANVPMGIDQQSSQFLAP